MPIPINHKGPRFREYKQSPVEKELHALKEEVARLSKLVNNQAGDTTPAENKDENPDLTEQED